MDNGGKIWVLLAAGSNTYENYRHQADVCHAYQIVHANGIPDEQIVVMMYNDIADNAENPTPGIIINEPNGPDVYNGVPTDYTKKDVTTANFLSILQGDSNAMGSIGSGKVIASGSNDHVFVYYADHGAEGLVAFPTGDYLYADDLNSALQKMYDNNKFAKLVFYLEACESGSMFENILPDTINIFATTASSATDPSYGTYCATSVGSCLGDEYSVAWMQDSDSVGNLENETLDQQFTNVVANTPSSVPQRYGDLDIGSDSLAEYQGGDGVVSSTKRISHGTYRSVNARDVPLENLKMKLERASTREEKRQVAKQLVKRVQDRKFLDSKIKSIVTSLVSSEDVERVLEGQSAAVDSFQCYRQAVDYFNDNCFDITLNTYALGHLQVLANLCNMGFDTQTIKESMDGTCTHPTIVGII
jgi:legumain